MASQPPNVTYLHQLPPQYFTQHYPIQPGYGQQFGGPSYAPGPPAYNAESSTRIAVLEKELEQCQVEKATAELTVQHLANLNAKGRLPGGNEKEVLLEKLAQANQDNVALKTKMETTWAILSKLMTTYYFVPFPKSNTAAREIQHPRESLEAQDLIDLVGFGKEHRPVGDDTTLLGDSQEDCVEEEEVEQVSQHYDAISTAFPGASYIHHFTSDESDVSRVDDNKVKTSLKHESRTLSELNVVILTGDEHSEATAEPGSDESSHDYSASSTPSFVTANVETAPEAEPLANATTTAIADSQQLTWELASSFDSSNGVGAPTTQRRFDRSTPSRTHGSGFAFAKASLDPTLTPPYWKVSKIFPTTAQRDRAITLHKSEVEPHEHCFPDFFKYGIRFTPDDSEPDVYRTILISNTPLKTTIHQLLERVCGGLVIDAKLLDTGKLCGGSNTALIIFLHEHSARSYSDYAKTHPVTIANTPLQIKLLTTPTWPISPNIKTAITDHHHTRCLEVYQFPRYISASKLRADLGVCAQMEGDRVEYLKMRKDGVLELRFNSINDAGRGFGMLSSFRAYRGTRTFFVDDPCADPVETLGGGGEVVEGGKMSSVHGVSHHDKESAGDQQSALNPVTYHDTNYEDHESLTVKQAIA